MDMMTLSLMMNRMTIDSTESMDFHLWMSILQNGSI